MKIVKLNRRYKMYENGFTHALRWDRWDHRDIKPYASALENSYGNMSYNYRQSAWVGNFGSSKGLNRYKPYYIYVRSEAMLTVALLGASV